MCKDEEKRKTRFARKQYFIGLIVFGLLCVIGKGMYDTSKEKEAERMQQEERDRKEKETQVRETIETYNKLIGKAVDTAKSCSVITENLARAVNNEKTSTDIDQAQTKEREALQNMSQIRRQLTIEEKDSFPGICREIMSMECCCIEIDEIFQKAETYSDLCEQSNKLNEEVFALNGHIIMLEAHLTKGEKVLEDLNRKTFSGKMEISDEQIDAHEGYVEKIQERLSEDEAYGESVTLNTSGLYQDNIFRLSYKKNYGNRSEEIAFIDKIQDFEAEVFPEGETLVALSDGCYLVRSENVVLVNGESVTKEMLLRAEAKKRKMEEEKAQEKNIPKTEKPEEETVHKNGGPVFPEYNSQNSQVPPADHQKHEEQKSTDDTETIEEEDPLNVKDYWSYEDFYEDNVDEFDGIDDAEDYYDEHGGF